MGEKRLAEAYILGIPFGLFGAHHFYLGRNVFGILYLCTLGLFGIGYLYDLIRMRWLVRHANRYGNERKMISDCYLLGFLGGLFGAHHFYLGNKKLGIVYICILGVFGIGWIVDLLRMRNLLEASNNNTDLRSLGTAYILACSPLGVFGAYHYYLGNWKLGLIYTFTLGIFGIGWIVDLFRMKDLVKASNDDTGDHGMTKITAYVLCVSPLGLFGAHHFYLKRYLNGGLYAATFGLFGIGWIFDMIRLPVLYERYATEDEHKYVDEAYIFWFPFGLFGLHQFYLGNKKWGLLYACTFGCLGIGWVIDGLRLPSMVRDFNKTVEDPDRVEFRICRPNCKPCSQFVNLILGRKSHSSYDGAYIEDHSAIGDSDISSQDNDLTLSNGTEMATVQDSYHIDMTQQACFSVAHPGHPVNVDSHNGDDGLAGSTAASPSLYESQQRVNASESADNL